MNLIKHQAFFGLLFLTLWFSSINVSQGQNSSKTHEIGLMLGTSYYIGDVTPYNHLDHPNIAGGILHRLSLNKRYAIKTSLNFVKLSGDDSGFNAMNQTGLEQSFNASILELTSAIEFNFMEYVIGDTKTPFSPYIFVGLGAFFLDSESDVEEDISTSPVQPVLPFGAGLKFNLNNKIGMALEWGYRKTLTDFIDNLPTVDSSGLQQGNSQNKDWYALLGIMITFKINNHNTCPQPKY